MELKARAVWACLGATIGFAIGYLTAEPHSPAAPPAPVDDARRAAPDAPGADERGSVEREAAATEGAAPLTRDAPQSLISPLLHDYAVGELHRGWAGVRNDTMPTEQLQAAMQQFEAAVLAMPHALGEQFARAQDQRDARTAALAADDGVALLASLASGDPEAAALLRDGERFAALFAPRAGGPVVMGTSKLTRIDDRLDDGAVLSYGPGVFEIRDLMKNKDPFPSDVTLRGAGIDATLLVLNELSTRGPLRRFRIEDCTVFTNDYLTDLRHEPAVMSFRSVRFVGFDIGAGGSLCFSVDRAAIHARLCRFEGGYGRSPGSGNLLRTGGPSLCRFESCSFSRIRIGGFDDPTAAFVDCVMTEMLGPVQEGQGVTLEGCRVEVRRGASDTELRRDLDELFPQWRERLQR